MISINPFPAGKCCAVTFIDDTDHATLENVGPVYEYLRQRGFWGTKTVWPSIARRSSAFSRALEGPIDASLEGATLEDPRYAEWVRSLDRGGFEVALHGIAAGNSRRSEVEEGLARFRAVLGHGPRINAFHKRNLENLYCGRHKLDSAVLRFVERATDRSAYEGHAQGSPSFWGDIALDTFDYVRLPFHTIDEVNTLKVNPSMPFRDERRPFVRRWFAASDGSDVRRFTRLLAPRNVDRLLRERGASIVYTHFAKGFAAERGSGRQLAPAFVSTVEALTSREGVWFTTVGTLLDRLAAIQALALTHTGRTVRLEYSGAAELADVELRFPPAVRLQDEAGRTIDARDGAACVGSLRPGCRLLLDAGIPGDQRISPSKDRDVPRRERRRIEYFNYLGLLRGTLRDWLDDRRR